MGLCKLTVLVRETEEDRVDHAGRHQKARDGFVNSRQIVRQENELRRHLAGLQN